MIDNVWCMHMKDSFFSKAYLKSKNKIKSSVSLSFSNTLVCIISVIAIIKYDFEREYGKYES